MYQNFVFAIILPQLHPRCAEPRNAYRGPKDSRSYVDGLFILKLNHTSNGHSRVIVRICTMRGDILDVINGWMKSDKVYGYYVDVIIQPFFRDSNEVKVVCNNGLAISSNKTKTSMRRLPMGPIVGKRGNRDALFDFCGGALKELKADCLELIDGSLLSRCVPKLYHK